MKSHWGAQASSLSEPASCRFVQKLREATSFPRVPLSPLLPLAFLLTACTPDMGVQPKYKPYEKSDFFENGSAMRPIPAHTVARGQFHADDPFYTGMQNGVLVTEFPEPVTQPLLARGREQYNVYCSVCHGFTGSGDGMIVQRGFPKPPSFHDDRLRNAPTGHFFDVITRGYGVMFSYASRVEPPDRWAIAAYIRALQLSQHAPLADAPSAEQAKLGRGAP